MAICNNVTPAITEQGKEYQASSPDEIALVKYADLLGFDLAERDHKGMVIKDPLGNLKEVEILECFPFTSETKRMGIIVQHKDSGMIVFFCKGAEVVMTPKLKAS